MALFAFCCTVFALVGGVLTYALIKKAVLPTALQLAVNTVFVIALWFLLVGNAVLDGETIEYVFYCIAVYHTLLLGIACITKLIVGLLQKHKQTSTQKTGE